MKVLVVEDSPTSLKAVSQQLRRIGVTPVAADDGASGIRMYREHKPDLILLDVVMPDMDGYEVARRIRSREKTGEWTPILFLTALVGDDDLARGIAAGGDDYLLKPVSEVVLGAKLRAMQRIIDMRGSLITMTQKLDAANRELRHVSIQDSLTGIANRRHFDDSLKQEWRRALRARRPLALILFDIDYFKQYNDVYGHQAGDECLRAVAGNLARHARRPGDWVARFGGEEFAVVLSETDARGAVHLAEQMRAAIDALAIPHSGSAVGRTVSISAGVASMVPESASGEPDELVQWADAALYDAKRQGRNRVVSYNLVPRDS
ncbi:MAG: diguanylate cyclase domain protein [Proteobacteria bacterium]|nr:diguanylate cyclase domain protein [Pseudomonadota bacterium]